MKKMYQRIMEKKEKVWAKSEELHRKGEYEKSRRYIRAARKLVLAQVRWRLYDGKSRKEYFAQQECKKTSGKSESLMSRPGARLPAQGTARADARAELRSEMGADRPQEPSMDWLLRACGLKDGKA